MYLLKTTSRKKYYVGMTHDPLQRFLQHLVERAAAFTRGHKPFESTILAVYDSEEAARRGEREWCDRLRRSYPDLQFNMGEPTPDLRGSYDGPVLPSGVAARRLIAAWEREEPRPSRHRR